MLTRSMALMSLVTLLACGDDSAPPAMRCMSSVDCAGGRCVNGFCVPGEVDASADVATDTGSDTGIDSSQDAEPGDTATDSGSGDACDGFTFQRTQAVPVNLQGLAAADDGELFGVAHVDTRSVVVTLDPDTGATDSLINLTFLPAGLAVSNDRYFVDNPMDREIMIFDRLDPNISTSIASAIDSDSRGLAVIGVTPTESSIWHLGALGGEIGFAVSSPAGEMPVFHPVAGGEDADNAASDGPDIFFVGAAPDITTLHVLSRDGVERCTITLEVAVGEPPTQFSGLAVSGPRLYLFEQPQSLHVFER